MVKLTVILLLMFAVIGCGDNRYTFDMATWDGADDICSGNKGIKSLTVTRHFPPKLAIGGMKGAISIVKCNDGAIYYNKSDKRYPVKKSVVE
ncbi:hypothetical protein KAR91_26835 [Candidatus Pacearchaeota archaeon]|nr:hypothetical protein [Candidatus Pacearchaeota archaeon]